MRSGRKRRRGSAGELGRVAEIVMVLAAVAEARGGRAPMPAELALAAEARARLVVAAAGQVRPKELFPREAVRALVGELGLTRARDPASMGYRPHRASIADRILLTKRKMEEVKEAAVRPTTSMPQTTASSSVTAFQRGASNSSPRLSKKLSAAESFPVTTRVTLSETLAGASSAKSANIPSIVSLPPVVSASVSGKGVGAPNFTQSGEGNGQGSKSAHDTAETVNRLNQNIVQSFNQTGLSEDKIAATRAVTGNTVMKQQSVFCNHSAIAKTVMQILHQPANHPIWTLPSTEYMHARLYCQICEVSIDNVESVLVCDACEKGVHLKCLKHYVNNGLPTTEWYCPTCISHSKGKPLPPKYGKVTRAVVAPKVGPTSGVTSQGASENPITKGSS